MYVSLRLSVRTLLLRAEQAGTGVNITHAWLLASIRFQ